MALPRAFRDSSLFVGVELMGTAPPKVPPPVLLPRYTMEGLVPVEHFYVDDTDRGKPTHYTFPSDDLKHMLAEAHRSVANPMRLRLPKQRWLAEAIVAAMGREDDRASAENKQSEPQAVVFGSSEPWVECLLLAAGAQNVTTVEYNYRTYEDTRLVTTTVADFKPSGQFDVAVAHGAFDHDGLGRYGDPLNPDGDLLAMRAAWRSLRPGGVFLLSLPVGPDLLVWNLHRRYGELRLPRMLAGWEEVNRVGWADPRLTTPADHRHRYEPIFVLRRNSSALQPAPLPVEAEQQVTKEEL